MPAGLNLVGCVWRFAYPQDDSVGGAVPSGTMIYQDVQGRITSQRPNTVLLEQGLETVALYNAILWPGTLEVSENDQFEVIKPYTSLYYGWKFVILGVQHTSGHYQVGQGYLIVQMRRKTEARSVQSAG